MQDKKIANQLRDAEVVLREVLEVNVRQPEVWYKLGVLLHSQKRDREAKECFCEALQYDAMHANAQCGIGAILVDEGDLHGAERILRQVAQAHPENVQAHMHLGVVYAHTRNFQGAIHAFQQAIKLNPENPVGYACIGDTFYEFEQFEQAEKSCEIALRIDPKHVQAIHTLAKVYAKTNRQSMAIATYKKLHALAPAFSEGFNSCASLYNALGMFEDARKTYERGFSIDPANGVLAHNMTGVKGFKATDQQIEFMKLGYETTPIIQQKIYFGFALGRSYETQKKYEDAFRYYDEANSLHFKLYPYNHEASDASFKRVTAVFNQALIARQKFFGSNSQAPIFIVGMPRSGSTLVEQILASHSKVSGGDEMPVVPQLVDKAVQMLTGQPYPESVTLLTETHLHQLATHYLAYTKQQGLDNVRITDKLLGNYISLGIIYMMFPKAKVIHCRRDALDTCVSIYKHCFYAKHPYGSDLRSLGLLRKNYEKIMQHWHSVLPQGHIFDLQYEDMVNDTEGMTRRLLEFCGLEWEDACLNFHETKREVRTASLSQVREPIYKGSIGSWRKYERHLGPLKEALGLEESVTACQNP